VLTDDFPTVCSIEGNFMFDPATHRDFLGAVLGTGIDRKKIGDINLQVRGDSYA
jgi:RNA-binding protein YlmH